MIERDGGGEDGEGAVVAYRVSPPCSPGGHCGNYRSLQRSLGFTSIGLALSGARWWGLVRVHPSLGPGTNFLFIPIIGPLSHPPSPRSHSSYLARLSLPSIEQMGNKQARAGVRGGREGAIASRRIKPRFRPTGFISLT